jgi:hypothetical protein
LMGLHHAILQQKLVDAAKHLHGEAVAGGELWCGVKRMVHQGWGGRGSEVVRCRGPIPGGDSAIEEAGSVG